MVILAFLGLALRSLGLLLITGLGALVLVRASASTRRIVWLAGIASLLVLPAAYALLPHAKVATDKIPGFEASLRTAPVHAVVQNLADHVVPHQPLDQKGYSVVDPKTDPLNPYTVAVLAWAAASVLIALRILLGLRAARRLVRTAQPYKYRHLHLMQGAVGVIGPVRLLSSNRLTVPAATGWLHPAIIFPEDAREWPEARIQMVLAHELAHIRQNDWIFAVLAQFVCAMYPWNPFAWISANRLRAESELAADDRAVLCGIDPAAYAMGLVEIAASARRQTAMVVAMAKSSRVESRVRAIVNGRTRRGSAALGSILLAGMLAATACAGISAFRLRNIGQQPAEAGAAMASPSYPAVAGWKGPLHIHIEDANGRPVPGATAEFMLVGDFGFFHFMAVTADPPALTNNSGDYDLQPERLQPPHGAPGGPDGLFRAGAIQRVMAYRPDLGFAVSEPIDKANSHVTLRFEEGNLARIRVVAADNRPAAGVPLTAYELGGKDWPFHVPDEWHSGVCRAVTDQNGIATFRGLPNGWSVTYQVDDQRFLNPSTLQDNPTVSGETDYPTLHLVEASTVQGYARANGKPLPTVKVRVTGCTSMIFQRSAVTDAAGYYRISRIPNGPCDVHYDVKSAVPEGMAARQHNNIELGVGRHVTGVDFDFVADGEVKGTITDENGKPKQFCVSVLAPDFVERHLGMLGNPSDFGGCGDPNTGGYEIRLPPGRYLLKLGVSPGPPDQWVTVTASHTTIADFHYDSRVRGPMTSLCKPPDDD